MHEFSHDTAKPWTNSKMFLRILTVAHHPAQNQQRPAFFLPRIAVPPALWMSMPETENLRPLGCFSGKLCRTSLRQNPLRISLLVLFFFLCNPYCPGFKNWTRKYQITCSKLLKEETLIAPATTSSKEKKPKGKMRYDQQHICYKILLPNYHKCIIQNKFTFLTTWKQRKILKNPVYVKKSVVIK